jgi:hypothetical protein
LGISRIDPCSKYLKRVPLREALDRLSPGMKCSHCDTVSWRKEAEINIVNQIEQKRKVYHCPVCSTNDAPYGNVVQTLMESMKSFRKLKNRFKDALLQQTEKTTTDSLIEKILEVNSTVQNMVERLDRTMIPQHRDGGDLHVVLGMDNIEDCDRDQQSKSILEALHR